MIPMKKLISILLATLSIILISPSCLAHVGDFQNAADESTVYTEVDQAPEFTGGQVALMNYLARSIRYPAKEQEEGIQGKVVVSFIVERDGSISDVKVVKSVSEGLDREAKRVVRNMPAWVPGKVNGKEVRSYFTLPITFRIG